ncbi:UNVERIFIED_CONTAM: hypothetical protein FKN15_061858 [Acipenser sinensis]
MKEPLCLVEYARGPGATKLSLQDPLDLTRTVIVIRSLVAGGVAESSGGLLPGDRLVFVNDKYLDDCNLAQAVEVLKSVPPGRVFLGICKPLVPEMEEVEKADLTHTSPQREVSIEKEQAVDPDLVTAVLPAPQGFDDESFFQEEFVDEPQAAPGILFTFPQTQSSKDNGMELKKMKPLEREMMVDEEYEGEMSRFDSIQKYLQEAWAHVQPLHSTDDWEEELVDSVDPPPTYSSFHREVGKGSPSGDLRGASSVHLKIPLCKSPVKSNHTNPVFV